MTEAAGYRYATPDSEELLGVDVLYTHIVSKIDLPLTASVQTIMREALTSQCYDTSLEVMRAVMQAYDMTLGTAEKQRKQLGRSSFEAGKPLHVHAILYRENVRRPNDLDGIRDFDTQAWMVGVGKAKYADSRSSWRKHLSMNAQKAANLADVSDVYVLPTHAETGIRRLQDQGVGYAILRTMLDHYPENMPAVIYEYPALNHRAVETISNLGFTAIRTRQSSFCGIETPQVMYAGPFVGDLIETIEKRKPWLQQREELYLKS